MTTLTQPTKYGERVTLQWKKQYNKMMRWSDELHRFKEKNEGNDRLPLEKRRRNALYIVDLEYKTDLFSNVLENIRRGDCPRWQVSEEDERKRLKNDPVYTLLRMAIKGHGHTDYHTDQKDELEELMLKIRERRMSEKEYVDILNRQNTLVEGIVVVMKCVEKSDNN